MALISFSDLSISYLSLPEGAPMDRANETLLSFFLRHFF